MQKYNYRAKTKSGKTVKGIVETRSKKEALRLLHGKKLIVFSLQEKRKNPFLLFYKT